MATVGSQDPSSVAPLGSQDMTHSRPVRLVGLLRAKAAALEAVSAVALLLPFVLASASLMGYRAAVAPLAAATALGATGAACATIPPTCERGVLLPSRFRWTLVLTSSQTSFIF